MARRENVTLEDLACDTVLRAARPPAPYWQPPEQPWTTSEGRPVERGAAVATIQELFAAVAAGAGICPLAAHAADYFGRPGVAFVPFRDAPPARWVLVWQVVGETQRVRAFAELARRSR